jgi:hypothetical protein
MFIGLLWLVAPGRRLSASNGQSVDPIPGDSEVGALISDSLFLYAPSVLDFDTQAFLETQPGPLAGYVELIDGQSWTAADSIQYNAMRFGLNPQLILTLLEAQTLVLTGSSIPIPLGSSLSNTSPAGPTFHGHIRRLAEQALLAYDGHRFDGANSPVAFPDGETLTASETLNAGSYAVQATLAESMSRQEWASWIEGSRPRFVEQFERWFGDPRYDPEQVTPTATSAPSGYSLPFPIGETWYYTGGPHYYGGGSPGCTYGWNCPRPWSSLDFAQPEMIACPGGGYPAHRWIVAAKSGDVIQSSQALVVIDHRDGWRTYYSHVSSAGRRGLGPIDRGDRLGHPSCEVEPGGFTTGIHVHFALYQVGVGFVNVNGMAYSGWLVGETNHYNGTMRLASAVRQASIGRHSGINDVLNSGVNGSCPVSGGVVLYKHANYDCDGQGAGSGYVLQSGSGFFDLPTSFENQASSIRIPSGWSARLYEFFDGAGASVCRNGDDLTFAGDTFEGSAIPLNDRVSSFEIFENDDCSGPFISGPWSMTPFSDKELTTPCDATVALDSDYIFRDWGGAAPTDNCPADNWGARFTRRSISLRATMSLASRPTIGHV